MRTSGFDLSRKQLTQDQVTYLVALLKVDRNIELLLLDITEAELPNLLNGLTGNTTLRKLELKMSEVSDDAMQFLNQIYQQSGVQSITTNDGARAAQLAVWGSDKVLQNKQTMN